MNGLRVCLLLVGFNYALESCKSSVITCALFDGEIDPKEASELSRLEVRHQVIC